jgi:nucleoid-associated protein YejK
MRAEMQLSEMSKLSAGVAKKASQDELLKAIRVFVNKSKRKKIEKRIAVKEMVLEMANANSMTLPEELAVTIDSLDDEQPEAKVVNVAGNYNDIHDNSNVNRA